MLILVYADWHELGGPVLMGELNVDHIKGREVFSFAYDKKWLKSKHVQTIDPDLQLYSGPQYLSADKKNFSVFLDSSPDRWGRVLMDRREALMAKQETRKPGNLFEEDYLLGVFDAHRMGALRFKRDPQGDFLNNNKSHSAPPWATLRELENASIQLEQGLLKDIESLKWINMLLAPGASLGGARPKAGVLDPLGNLWIAKFPSVNDKINVGAWEMVAHRLALKSGIQIAEASLKKFNTTHHSFLSKRFDRIGEQRIHFASAMTLLGHNDGADGVSYLDIAAFTMQHGAQVQADLEELWLRIVFNIAIKNTDDHLRNHGFILTTSGWKLSPAYDINPVYHGKGLTLNISQTDNALDFDLALSVIKYFRIPLQKAKKIIEQVKNSVTAWNEAANEFKIPVKEIELMSAAFES
ncbi:MAG: HipA domain protein [Chitinophagaceae bacterium]|nr:HipA domain protein [Chitinophagaceae bacterium]